MSMKKVNLLQRQGDGFIDWGRNSTVNGVRGEGRAQLYHGEAAEVMKLVLKYMEKRDEKAGI